MKRLVAQVGVVTAIAALAACSDSEVNAPPQEPATDSIQSAVVAAPPAPVAIPAAAPVPVHSGVFINDRELSADQLAGFEATYGSAPPAGRFWYDPFSGAWGAYGRETAGFILPGHDLGAVAADASAGDTGVFINGREIPLVEAIGLQATLGTVQEGRWWLDGRTANFGAEGSPVPIGNLLAVINAQMAGAAGATDASAGGAEGAGAATGEGDNFWYSATARGNSSGGCSYVAVGGTTVSSGCD